MKTISDSIQGDLTIKEDSTFHNVYLQSLIVEENIMARLYGIVEDTIHIKKGATVYLHGKLQGEVINEGGIVYIFSPNGQIQSFYPGLAHSN
ncbi:MAG TPA: hypothetical protein VI112_17090 [Bacteroidia bacterium]